MDNPLLIPLLFLGLYGLFKLYFYLFTGEIITLKDLFESVMEGLPQGRIRKQINSDNENK